jgi:hypothetical protein
MNSLKLAEWALWPDAKLYMNNKKKFLVSPSKMRISLGIWAIVLDSANHLERFQTIIRGLDLIPSSRIEEEKCILSYDRLKELFLVRNTDRLNVGNTLYYSLLKYHIFSSSSKNLKKNSSLVSCR